ncbi:MAG: DNA translocase FtsK, partial [Nitratireductor sp.]
MRTGNSAALALGGIGQGIQNLVQRLLTRALGLALLAFGAFAIAALATWNVADPSFSHATGNTLTNAMGYPGAVVADLAMQFLGLASVAALVPVFAWSLFLLAGRPPDRLSRRGAAWAGAALLSAAVAGCIVAPPTWPLPSGLGGVFGDMVLKLPALLSGGYPQGLLAAALMLLFGLPALWLMMFATGLISRRALPVDNFTASEDEDADEDFTEADDDDDGVPALGAVFHWWLSARAFVRRLSGRRDTGIDYDDAPDEIDDVSQIRPGRADRLRVEPEFESLDGLAPEPVEEPDFDDPDEFEPMPRQSAPQPARAAARVENPAPKPKPGARVQREAQTSFIDASDFEMPTLHFLAEPKNVARDPSLSTDALEQNARLLEGVLEDFGVKGEIIHVRPGPVVTLYELEPAPGIKSSRVIGLADDIARSMSAIACRDAEVPGRNAIGNELPNARRETVFLREILASRDYEQTKAKLGLALGKTINGEVVIADLAKMPHVLVAGTTGSGKSVAINTMILSILYRMRPEQCRLIMIDPKMLELSVYDGIPHLLTPVVTDPKTAVVALKWTVREMEDRYRKMSKVGVRNIDGFNQRVAQATKKGEAISRTVQTGFDRETGEAIYETETLDLAPLPYIVVIIDEMADLMMVAGKDIEGAVQRLAQMA